MEDKLPIIEVTGDNYAQVWPCMAKAFKDATFIAMDCELSGLGNRSKINSSELDLRYQNLVELANSHAIVALGISCFSCNSVSSIDMQEGNGKEQTPVTYYMVQTFNVLTMCSDPFTVECGSLKFLHNHGFDFNKLYAKGVLYYKGCDRRNDNSFSVRQLFTKMLEYRKPLIVHNGLIDLVFLYQSFYCDLPKKNDTFAADLDDLFPEGVYDTKYLAEFHQAFPATYLEYLFKKMQLKNASCQKKGEWHVRLCFPPYPRHAPNIDWYSYLQVFSYRVQDDPDDRELCKCFAYHGYCKNDKCMLGHNINRVVKELQTPGAKKQGNSKYYLPRRGSLVHIIEKFSSKAEETRPQKREASFKEASITKKQKSPKAPNEPEQVTKEPKNVVAMEVKQENSRGVNGHRAGYDAFMTGFVFATIVSMKGQLTSKDDPFTPKNIGLADQVNKVFLMGKDFPFLIRTGHYSSKSSNHCGKIINVRKGEITQRKV
ncbi:Target of EGR1 protein 1 [Chionoecetes opilio]|uniref:Target of EGR1 protein 1 n=1 Tax=Chionoecetes opilio TaxID=41210 RepID=A0A8J4Y9V6_CHIOP|nr:Target of EGR1 protein 1 [Chionoecetes opilio]